MNASITKPRRHGSDRSVIKPLGSVGQVRRAGRSATLLAAAGLLYSAPSARAEDMKSETLEAVKSATVMVWNAASKREKGDTKLGSGSGYFINGTGLLITNNHVVDPGHGKSPREKWELTNQYNLLVQTVVTDSGTEEEKTWECELLYTNEAADQALLQALDEEGNRLETSNYLKFLPETQLTKRIKLVAFGFPGGDSRSVSSDKHPEVNIAEGHVLELPRTPGGRVRRIYTDAEVRAGNSGGPVVDVDGLVVGTLTLGVANEERRNFNALVPATLTRQFIRAAFELGKVPGGGDVVPFVDILTDADGRTVVPEFERLAEQDVLFYENGDRIYGKISTESITWESALGKLEVPTRAIAYVMSNDEGANLFLEGGNRIASSGIDSAFQFEPEGGQPGKQNFSDVGTVAFRAEDRKLAPVKGEVIVLETDVCRLVLTDIQGTLKFESRAGLLEIAIDELVRFDPGSGDDRVLQLNDGRRLTGKFGGEPLGAVIAATRTPVRLDLSNIEKGRIEIVEMTGDRIAGLSLTGVLASADKKIRRLAKILESNEPADARAKLDQLMEPRRLKRLSDTEKQQVYLLDAVAKLREGQAKTASKAFRKCSKAADENIAAYALACSNLLKHYEDFQFEGKPLSDRPTFVSAGEALADQRIKQVRDLIDDAEAQEDRTRGEYLKAINAIKKNETAMTASALFAGVAADDELIRLWKLAVDVCTDEIQRINDELEEKTGSRQDDSRRRSSRRRGSRGGGGRQDREVEKLNEQKDEVLETIEGYAIKLGMYGFRIEDPDIQERKEREDEEEPEEEP